MEYKLGNVIRSKSACLDERDPNAQAMPEPTGSI